MLKNMLARMLGVKPLVIETKAYVEAAAHKKPEHPLGKMIVPRGEAPVGKPDPLAEHSTLGVKFDDLRLVTPDAYKSAQAPSLGPNGYVGDSMVSGQGGPTGAGRNAYMVPEAIQAWYTSQSFIGHQACAIIAQHWLIDKACSMPGRDAVRNGYEVTLKEADPNHPEESGFDSDDIIGQIADLDLDFDINNQLIQFWRFTQIFGVRVCVFDVEYEDKSAIEQPFNIDGVVKGSYKGIRQVDPYWCMPQVTSASSVDPSSPDFYDPEFWIIGGKKYHKSHLVIGRGAEPADILKPTYIYGGVPLVQNLYERVYAAERTANEGPMLAMTKRTTTLKADLALAEAQPERFWSQMAMWAMTRDNYGVKVISSEDSVEQFDTSLADLDAVIMNQYQLVAAISQVPADKLLGTSPKGFSSTGEFETVSYHEHLESVQRFQSLLLSRHHMLLAKSVFGVDLPLNHTWKRVGSLSEAQLAELNAKKAETGERLINDGSISPEEERNRLRNDPLSGYGHLQDDVQAETTPGASPENEKGEVESEAKSATAESHVLSAEKKPEEDPNAGEPATDSDAGSLYSDVLSKVAQFESTYFDDPTVHSALPVDLMNNVASQLDAIMQQTVSNGPTADPQHLAMVNAQLDTLLDTLSAFRSRRSAQPSVTPSVGASVRRAPRETADDARTGVEAPAAANGLPSNGGVDFTHRAFGRKELGRGLVAMIENPAGSIRGGVARDGTKWRSQMPGDYGFFEGTKGADGDEVDVMIGPAMPASWAYIINQIEPTTGEFDEHKVYIGYANERAARDAYIAAYQSGWGGLGNVRRVSVEELRSWLDAGPCVTPYL